MDARQQLMDEMNQMIREIEEMTAENYMLIEDTRRLLPEKETSKI